MANISTGATAIGTIPVVVGPVKPPQPVDPTYCPTCLSGTPPIEPGFEDAIRIEDVRGYSVG